MRSTHRAFNELRPIRIIRPYTQYAEGSVWIAFGNTQVVCTASIVEGVPKFLKGSMQGWITAEYGMLPRATQTRNDREAARGKQVGRNIEIQRLIGRALRASVNLKELGENTIILDCDVIQADGGTRTAAITGASIALIDALDTMERSEKLKKNPSYFLIAAVSVGIYQGEFALDLDYAEDCKADSDMNVVLTEKGDIIEIQVTAEQKVLTKAQFNGMLALAELGVSQLFKEQKKALGEKKGAYSY